MNPALERLQAYPFERLAQLLAGSTPPPQLRHIGMSIGEPKHAPPALVLDALRAHLTSSAAIRRRAACRRCARPLAAALRRRCLPGGGQLDPDSMVLPVNGTREALFAFVQAAVDRSRPAPLVAMPNPCYQIYEGAAILAGAEPYYLDTTAANRFVPDLDAVPDAVWRSLPGAVPVLARQSHRRGAVAGLPEARARAGRDATTSSSPRTSATPSCTSTNRAAAQPAAAARESRPQDRFERCMVFHSLSKRSSLPGLRSGFVAGDPALMRRFLLYRTYHGCAMPVPTQLASVAAWGDDAHVAANRAPVPGKIRRACCRSCSRCST